LKPVDGVEIAIMAWFAGSALTLLGLQFFLFAWLSARDERLDFGSLGRPHYLVRKYIEACERESRPERGVVPLMTLAILSTLLSTFFLAGMMSGKS
jgi:hypothetical protein